MKLYSSYLIFQHQVFQAKTFGSLKKLCERHHAKLEIEIFSSAFSKMKWELPSNRINGKLFSYLITTLTLEGKTLTTKPFELQFEPNAPTTIEKLETTILEGIQESLKGAYKSSLINEFDQTILSEKKMDPER